MYPEGQEILVVIDDRERRERVARILADEGFAVSAAAEGLAALRAIGARRYALVVAATRLPGSLDGATTVRQARSRQPWLKALYGRSEATAPTPRPVSAWALVGWPAAAKTAGLSKLPASYPFLSLNCFLGSPEPKFTRTRIG